MDKSEILERLLQTPASPCDPETGLHREDYFQAILSAEMAGIKRTGEPLTLCVVVAEPCVGREADPSRAQDHAAVGALIRRTIREVDFATHCGGGLFLVLLRRTGAENAHIAAERIQGSVDESLGGRVTVSIGLASFPVDGVNREALIARATDAYAHAREAGPSGVFFFGRPERKASGGSPVILLVDDDLLNLKLLSAQISLDGFQAVTAASGEEALEVIRAREIDLAILDVKMPGISGFEVCRRIKNGGATRQVPVILLTALDDTESRLMGIQAGADDFMTKPANREELIARTRSLVKVKRLNRDLVSLENALISIANAVEAKDNYTLGHTQRVSTLAVALGTRLGLDDADLRALHLGGILHDVGKIGVPESVLNKPGPLNEEEWQLMKSHAEMGYKICLPLMESIGPALDVIRHHHERLDGSSYPDGIQGSGISIMARIMGVVDSYDAMITDRPYRAGMSKAKALAILKEEVARTRLDGRVVEALEGLISA